MHWGRIVSGQNIGEIQLIYNKHICSRVGKNYQRQTL
jgi:hypothetical protein